MKKQEINRNKASKEKSRIEENMTGTSGMVLANLGIRMKKLGC